MCMQPRWFRGIILCGALSHLTGSAPALQWKGLPYSEATFEPHVRLLEIGAGELIDEYLVGRRAIAWVVP